VFAPEQPILVLAERPRSLVQLMGQKGRSEAIAAAIKSAFGLDLPPPGKWAAGGEANSIWIQPGNWLLEAEPSPPGVFQARVAAAAANLGVAVDQSSGRNVIHLEGPPAYSVLATICRLDLHPRVFGPGSAAATRVAHVACVIRLADEKPSFDLIVGSTYARWLIEGLLEASHACGVRFDRAPRPYPSAMPATEAAR
jgi:heterotetrameric sarcosine oxidase gamma subunit